MFRNHTAGIAALLTLLSTAALPQTAFAASYLDSIPRGAKTVYTSSLADISNSESYRPTRTLDWQRPSLALYFDLPPAERTSDIVLTLSADPLSRVAKGAPLEVQFNNSKPVPIRSNGHGFEVRIPFEAAEFREHSNVIRITYPTPTGADCIMPSHGAWSINLSESSLRISGRAQKRHMNISEVSDYLAQPSLSPSTVGLIASGPNGADMQALAAQGIALRTPGVPNFSVTPRGNDFDVVMVKRNRLFDVTNDPMILNSEGPRIFVPRGRPTKLIFTADTDAEILKMLELFSTRRLPSARRPISSLGELNLSRRLGSDTAKIDKKSKLIDLAVPTNIAAGAQSFKFGVVDPVSSSGEILLRLPSAKVSADTSRVSVALNGKILGATKLDKKRKNVAFEIKPGILNATSNVLNIVPDMKAGDKYSCAADKTFSPEFYIGEKSRITLNKSTPSPVTELSRLTSTGGLFAESESYIALPKNTRDYQAALRILGRLAKSAGHGLTLADYSRGSNVPSDKHVLVIGPSNMTTAHLSGAPKALSEALTGQPSSGENLLQANFESFASAGTDHDIISFAAKQTAPRRVSRGGIAALYGSGNGNLTGIISTTPGQSFVQASQNIVDLNHWNAMRGGVARWTSSSVIMAQTAQSDAEIKLPNKTKTLDFPDLGLSGLDLPELSLPEIEWPDFNWPDFDMPQVSLPAINWPSFKSDEKTTELTPIQGEPKAVTEKLSEIKPRLKPVLKDASATSSGLRGTFKFDIDRPKVGNKFEAFQRGAKTKWSATKSWFRTKVQGLNNTRTLDEVSQATDRVQERVSPAGRSLKASLTNKLPGKGLVQIGDRTVSVYGLILIMAFGFLLLLMSLARPASRLGGRH